MLNLHTGKLNIIRFLTKKISRRLKSCREEDHQLPDFKVDCFVKNPLRCNRLISIIAYSRLHVVYYVLASST